jgi:hypothetical protein
MPTKREPTVEDLYNVREECVRVHRASDPAKPTLYRRGEMAEAEPAVPGWTFTVNDLFLLGEGK